MKLLKSINVSTLLFCLTLFILSCGGHSHSHDGDGHDHSKETSAQTEEKKGHDHDAHGHDHDGHDHDHDGGEHNHSTKAVHGEGKEYTSAYVCPMHCKDSGSDKEGKCPSCNMDYIAQAEHTKDGHKHDN